MRVAHLRVPAGLFVVAVAVRLFYLHELSASPISGIPLVDAETYNGLARQLAASGSAAGTALFWQPPLYPVLLAAIYKLLGPSILAAQIVQAILGGVTVSLTTVLGAEVIGRRAGIIAGLLVAFCGPLVFIEADLVASGIAALLSLVLVFVLMRASGERGNPERSDPALGARDRAAWAAAYGALGAAAVLIRPEFLVVTIGGMIWIAWSDRRADRRAAPALRTAGVAALGFLLIGLPVASFNLARGARVFSILPFSGGLNLYIGNNPDVCATLTARPGWGWTALTNLPNRDGPLGAGAYQAFYDHKVLDYAASRPLSFTGGLIAKCLRLVSSREIPRNVDPYVVRQWSRLLGVLLWKVGRFGFPFGVILPMAAVGAWRIGRRIPVAMRLFLVLYGLSVVAIFVADRYRAPMLPVLSVVAAGGAVELVAIVRKPRPRDQLTAAAIIIATLVVCTVPGPFCEERIDYAAELSYLIGLSHHHRALNAPDAPGAAQEIRQAEDFYHRALDRNPALSDAWNELGNLRTQEGRPDEAMACYATAVSHDPDHGKAWHNRGFLYYRAGDYKDAVPCLQRATDLDPTFTRSAYLLGRALSAEGRYEESIETLERAIGRERNAALLEQENDALAAAEAARDSARAATGVAR